MFTPQWEEVVKKMLLIEEGVFGNKEEKTREYRQFNHWILRGYVWPGQVLRKFKLIPGLRLYPLPPNNWKTLIKQNDWSSVAGPFLGWHIKPILEAPLKVDALRTDNCLVGIYVKSHQKLIIKSVLDENKNGTLLKEVENLKWVYSNMTSMCSDVRVPGLHYLNSTSQNPYFVMDFIAGRAAKDNYPLETSLRKNYWHGIAERIMQFTWLMYENWGIKYVPIREAYTQFANIGKIWSGNLNISKPLIEELRKLFEKCWRIFHDNRLLPCSFIHGDLKWEHVVVSKRNQVWLIDWGSAKVGPIIDDQENLNKMINGESRIVGQIAEHFHELSISKSNTLSFTEQRLLRALMKIMKLIVKYGMEQSGYDPFLKRNTFYNSLEFRIKEEIYKIRNLMCLIDR